MKKKLLSLMLALAVCLGLMVPAFADDELPISREEGLQNIEVVFEFPAGIPEENFFVNNPWIYKGWAEGEDPFAAEPSVKTEMTGYLVCNSDTQITVRNTGTVDDGSFIGIDVLAYEKRPEGEYKWVDFPESYYLTNSGIFVINWADSESIGGMVQLKAGQSVTFTLPTTWSEEDVIMVLRPSINYPQYNYSYYYRDYYIKLDDAAYNAIAAGGTASTAPAAPVITDPIPGFDDVSMGQYYAAPVLWALEKGIANGTGANKFSPDETCSNAQILTFLWRACGEPEPTAGNPYSNVAESAYYYKAALWASEKGLVSGTAFEADKPCTRAMTVTYLWQAAGSPGAAAASFTDVPASASYAAAVAWAVEQGITNGDGPDTFSPDKTCTRGQIVTFLYRAFA